MGNGASRAPPQFWSTASDLRVGVDNKMTVDHGPERKPACAIDSNGRCVATPAARDTFLTGAFSGCRSCEEPPRDPGSMLMAGHGGTAADRTGAGDGPRYRQAPRSQLAFQGQGG